MSKTAREVILSSLTSAVTLDSLTPKASETVLLKNWSLNERIEKLKNNLESVRGEVHITKNKNWIKVLESILIKRGISSILYSPHISIGKQISDHWKRSSIKLPDLIVYEENFELFKDKLFKAEASITSARGAIAENGSIILWPDKNEPRSMSLVPPVHIAVLNATDIFNTFSEALSDNNWIENPPTNAIMINGPSKTADIELILAFGVHGPKEQITLIITQDRSEM
ncbi:lactate utilization protein [bacterium]|nr:lactate utilization protein [bacterium]